eukprot:gene8189-11078_t
MEITLFSNILLFFLCLSTISTFPIKLSLKSFTRFKYSKKNNSPIDKSGELFLPNGFQRLSNMKPPKPKQPIVVNSVSQLKELISLGYRVQDVDVRGNTKCEYDVGQIHPVVKAIYERKANKSLPGNRNDNKRIAIAIEGGGMRGCVGAGMISAVSYLGLDDSVDVVYGSSAGSLVGAYFVTKQLPYTGPEVYYDVLTTAGKEFIDAQALLRSCGFGIFDIRLKSLVNLFTDRLGKPVLNLNYLFDTIVQKTKPLDWDKFWEMQINNKIELKVVASGLLSRKAVVLSAKNKNFQSLAELAECMKASMLLPGITGDVIRLKGSQASGDNIAKTWWREYTSRSDSKLLPGSEPMSDALIFEPVPYRSAIRENCTHVIVLRTRADNQSVTVKMGILEKLIVSRFFGRKQGLPDLVDWMLNQYHKLVYAEDMLILNEANRDMDDSEPEIGRMETSREKIFQSVRKGFAAAYDSLVIEESQKGRGWEVANEIWPDSILLNPPKHLANISLDIIIKKNEPSLVLPNPTEWIQGEVLKSDIIKLPSNIRNNLYVKLNRLKTVIEGIVENNSNNSNNTNSDSKSPL